MLCAIIGFVQISGRQMNKRACLILQNYFDIAPRARNEVRCLVEHGYDVDVISLRMDNDARRSYYLDGAHVITIAVSKKRAGKLRYFWEYLIFFIAATFILSRCMVMKNYDFVQVCNLPDFLIFSSLLPKILGAKVIFDMYEIMPEFFISKYRVNDDSLIIKFLKWQERQCFKFADKVIVINDPIKKTLVSRGLLPSKATVVMNSADERIFANAGFYLKNRDSECFIMMFHGTLTEIYGLDIAIRAFARVRQKLINAEFWIIGRGPEREKLMSLTQNLGLEGKIRFLDIVPQDEVPKLLTQSDVGILATRRDQFLDLSFSTKLPEYILMNKPVIASRLKSLQYYFSEDALAFFEPENETDLANRMVELYRNSDLCQKLAKQASIENSSISWNVMSRRYIMVVNSLAE